MKTIKEITAAFKAATQYEAWMDSFKDDKRTAVQKVNASLEKRLEKLAKIE